jgi:N-acetyl-1-D-myo-inositol-2-amino-2-deoxy-alpha-D-glucopyranoside deacetylase
MDPDGPLPPFVTADENLAAVVDGNAFLEQKMEAFRSYPTQVALDGPFFALSNNKGNEMWGDEYFRIVKGERGQLNSDGLETDLFSGV